MSLFLDDGDVRLYHGDALERLREMPSESVQCVITSPPFWGLRDYGTGAWDGGDGACDHLGHPRTSDKTNIGLSRGKDHQRLLDAPSRIDVTTPFRAVCGKCGARRVDQQIGLEETPDEWCARLVAVMREARRVLRSDGVCFLECGDTYLDKQLVGAPWKLAFALQADGWRLRSEIIWHKVNPMPESVGDRPTRGHSTVFLLAKSRSYFFDADSIREESTGDQNPRNGNGPRERTEHVRAFDNRVTSSSRNARTVWSIPSEPFSASALGCDTSYKASVDCPTHGLHADPQRWTRAARDEPLGEPRLYRIDSNDARRALEQATARAEKACRTSASDSPATSHSTQSRRTDHAPATTQPCTPYDENPGRTAGTSASLESAETHASTPASSTDSDDSPVAALSADTPSRTAHKCSCLRQIIDHFATFPQALVERCIKAGTSEHGSCSECGAPWRRITERVTVREQADAAGTAVQSGAKHLGRQEQGLVSRSGGLSVSNSHHAGTPQSPSITQLGWEPSCAHDAPRVPCVCLDPFVGSGTTCLVSRRLGRHAIGIELNAAYLEIAARRLQQLSLLA